MLSHLKRSTLQSIILLSLLLAWNLQPVRRVGEKILNSKINIGPNRLFCQLVIGIGFIPVIKLYHNVIPFLPARAWNAPLGWTVMLWNDDWLCLPTFTDKANLGKRQPSLYWRRHRKTPQLSLHLLCTTGTWEAGWGWAPIRGSLPETRKILEIYSFHSNYVSF